MSTNEVDQLLSRLDAPARPTPLESLYRLLKKGFLPEASEKNNPDRVDNLLNLAHQGSPEPGQDAHILDLGAGDCLILEKLIALHHAQGKHGIGKIRYIAVDNRLRNKDDRWKSLVAKAQNGCSCFYAPVLFTMDIENQRALKRVLSEWKFTTIFMANILHELEPASHHALLRTLSRLLAENGKLVLLDPDSGPHFKPWPDLSVEWEAEAVWFSVGEIDKVLEAAGYKVTNTIDAHRTMDFWQVASMLSPGASLPQHKRRRIIDRLIKSFVREQLARGVSHCESLRNEVKKALLHSAPTDHVVIKVAEFFCACASQERRLEVLRRMGSHDL